MFEIHDDIEVLKRMGMAYNLEKGQCSESQLDEARRMVPKALESYVIRKYKIHPPFLFSKLMSAAVLSATLNSLLAVW